MTEPLFQNRSVLVGLLLGVLGLTRIWAMAATGAAALPHTLAALTVLIPAVLFGVFLRRIWPAAVGLVLVVMIELSLR